jgi:D-beta-D-heptose 7-phosphate kinase/D-beta-D-heptose 1-phosphate adenosyltransferase
MAADSEIDDRGAGVAIHVDWNEFNRRHILVVGDLMLDRYLWGDVERISPEAPVPVVRVDRRSESAGGAGNVAFNLVGLGARVTLVGVRGADEAGLRLRELMRRPGIRDLSIECSDRPTITKTRIVSGGQQLLRLDEEQIRPVGPEVVQAAVRRIGAAVEAADAIVLSDYGKGMLQSSDLCGAAVRVAQARSIPILADPKGRDWERYRGATCLTPNRREIEVFDGAPIESDDRLAAVMQRTIGRLGLSRLLVTQGASGMCLMGADGVPLFIPTRARQVYDVSGAGDTVVATLTLAVAAGVGFADAARLANLAAGVVVAKVGTQPINRIELEAALRAHGAATGSGSRAKVAAWDAALVQVDAWRAKSETIVFTNGCFDLLHPGHIHLLRRARELGRRLVVGLNADASVKRLKGPGRPILNERDRAAILGALDCVDLVVLFDEDTPERLIARLRPDVLVKGADYRPDQVVGRGIVESYGGSVQLIELLDGYSTTGIARKLRQAASGGSAEPPQRS